MIIRQGKAQPNATDDSTPPLDKRIEKKERIRDGEDVRALLFKKSGVDLFAIPGLKADTLLTLASEVGFDMSPWKTVKHFASWLSCVPGTNISGGKLLETKSKRNPNRSTHAF